MLRQNETHTQEEINLREEWKEVGEELLRCKF